MSEEYTMSMRLCDDAGMVSHEPLTEGGDATPATYLDRLNYLRSLTPPFGEHKPVYEPFVCTGSAHLASMYIRCTSPAHKRVGVEWVGAVAQNAVDYRTTHLTTHATVQSMMAGEPGDE